MTDQEAADVLSEWHYKHTKDDLFVKSHTGLLLTHLGRAAVKRLARYEVPAVREAMDATELEDKFARISGVFGRLGKATQARPGEPEWLQDMRHGDIVVHEMRSHHVGVVEQTGADGKIIWLVGKSQLRGTPYWAVLLPSELAKHQFRLIDPDSAERTAKAWADNLARGVYDGAIPECVRQAVGKYVPQEEPQLEPF